MYYRTLIQSNRRDEETRRITTGTADVETSEEIGKTQSRMDIEKEKERDEPTAGPSSATRSTALNTNFEKTENADTPRRSLTQKGIPSDEMMETPGDYISLSDDSEQGLNTSSMQKGKRRVSTKSSVTKKSKKKLYRDSEEETMEGDGVDTPLLMETSEMSANEVATKALSQIKNIEDIRIRSGRLQGALSGKMKRALETINDAVTCLVRKANEKGHIVHIRAKNIELTRNNIKLEGEIQMVKQENEMYKIMERENMRGTSRIEKGTQTIDNNDEIMSISEIGGRKRRRIEMQGTEAYKYAFLSSDVDPWTSEGEKRTETEEDTGGELIREYKRTARISHKRLNLR